MHAVPDTTSDEQILSRAIAATVRADRTETTIAIGATAYQCTTERALCVPPPTPPSQPWFTDSLKEIAHEKTD